MAFHVNQEPPYERTRGAEGFWGGRRKPQAPRCLLGPMGTRKEGLTRGVSIAPASALAYLELQLHPGDVLSALDLRQLLDVGVEIPGGHFGGAAVDGLQEGVVDEHVLVLRLHHVVALGAHERHVAVDVHRLLVFDPLQHGVDHDEAARAPHPRTAIRTDWREAGPLAVA